MGDTYANVLMEGITGLYMVVCVRASIFDAGPYKTIADVQYAIAGWATGTTTGAFTSPCATYNP